MTISLASALSTLRDFVADERARLLDAFCDLDAITGAPILHTMSRSDAATIDEFDELLALADTALLDAGIDPQPQRTNVTVLQGRNLRLISANGDDGPRAP